MDIENVEILANWAPLQNLRDKRSFDGFANFHRPLINHLSEIATPLIYTLKRFDQDGEVVVETYIGLWRCWNFFANDEPGVLLPVSYFSNRHPCVDCNFKIYDKEQWSLTEPSKLGTLNLKALSSWLKSLVNTQSSNISCGIQPLRRTLGAQVHIR